MNRFFSFFILILLSISLHAQQEEDTLTPEIPDTIQLNLDTSLVNLSTPRQTIRSHLLYLQEDTYQPELSARALNPNKLNGGKYSQEELISLAIKLKQIYDGIGFYIDLEEIPDKGDFTDSTKLDNVYYPARGEFPDIYLRKAGGKWMYSRKTVGNIPSIHSKIYPLGTDFLVKLTPVIGQKEFLGLKVWQYLGILILVGLSYLFYYIFTYLSNILIKKVVPYIARRTVLQTEQVAPVARPLSWFLVFSTISLFVPALQLPPKLNVYVTTFFKIIVPVFGILIIIRIIDLVADVSVSLASRTATTMDDQLIPLLRKIAKLVVGGLGFIFILDNLDVNVTALLAGVSIGGLALALAAQDTVKNLIGSLTIFVDQPFKVGDFIVTSAATGSVLEVGARSTRIRALDGALISVPNGELANLSVTNHAIRTYRRYATTLGVTYDTTPGQMETFVNGVRDITNNHPKTQEDSATVYFHEMGDSSLNIFFAAMFDVTDYGEWLAARQDIFLEIMRLAEKMGIGFAFPSTSVYVESLPEGFISKGDLK
ncbi:MAG: mechanosensitive ion channel family protein [Bacteroidota bacterium]